MSQPKILWNNVLRTANSSGFVGTPADGFTYHNLTDYQDYTLTRFADDEYAYYRYTNGVTIDSWGLYASNLSNGACEIDLYTGPSFGGATLRSRITLDANGSGLFFDDFTEVTLDPNDYIIIEVDTPGDAGYCYVRQCFVGQYLQPPQGQYASMTNPTKQMGYQMNSTISQNGDVLSRSIKRMERTGQLDISHITEQWYRDNWEPFAAHAVKYPFFYTPQPTDYPNETSYATAQKVVAGKPMGIGDLMSVSWKINSLVADGDYAV